LFEKDAVRTRGENSRNAQFKDQIPKTKLPDYKPVNGDPGTNKSYNLQSEGNSKAKALGYDVITWSASTARYLRICGRKSAKRKKKAWAKKARMTEILLGMPTGKTANFAEFRLRGVYLNQHYSKIIDFHLDPKHRDLRFSQHCRQKRARADMCQQIIKPKDTIRVPRAELHKLPAGTTLKDRSATRHDDYITVYKYDLFYEEGKELLFVLGAGGFKSKSSPYIQIAKDLRIWFGEIVQLVWEYYTSKLCPCCERDLSPCYHVPVGARSYCGEVTLERGPPGPMKTIRPGKRERALSRLLGETPHRKKVQKSPKKIWALLRCVHCKIWWHRDVVGCLNIGKKWRWALKNNKGHPAFRRRGQSDMYRLPSYT